MPSTYLTLAILGLSAIDPVGIFAMFVLLSQKQPLFRSFMFLAGSFVSLMILGLLFAKSLGLTVLKFENSNTWLVPSVELLAGLILLGIAVTLIWRKRKGASSAELSKNILSKLSLGNWRLFVLGGLIVTVQSVLDVVFVIAMVRVGQLHMTTASLVFAVSVYAVAALLIQIIIVVMYLLTPVKQRSEALIQIHKFSSKFVSRALIGSSLIIGCVLIAIAIRGII